MADNYLITGYWGEPHVTAENDRGINAAMFGKGRFVLPVGEQFNAEYIGNNTIRMYDGKLVDNGAAAGIPAGEYVDFLIANAGQGKKRNDLIVFQYAQDSSTLIESGKFIVIQGTETTGTAKDPELTEEDLLSGTATFDQMALWRISVSGTAISAPVQVFTLASIGVGKDYVDEALASKAPYGLTEEVVDAWDESELDAFLSRAYSEMGNNKVKFVTICPSYNIFGGIPTLAIIHKGYSNGMMSVYATATFISHGGYGGQRWYKSCENGRWSVLEWENPPMIAGVEYRTTERHNGYPVYTQLVDCDYMPNKGVKNNPDVYYGADPVENMVHKNDIAYMYAYACNDYEDEAGDFSIFPNISGGTNINADVWYDWTLGIVARTQSDMSNYKLMVVLKYTKRYF